jgi:predicted transglutaminase-like cysteine proteinase
MSLASLLAAALILAQEALASRLGLFRSIEMRAPAGAAIPQWQHLRVRLDQQRGAWQACVRDERLCGSSQARAWRALLRDLRGRPLEQQMRAVNDFANRLRYVADIRHWGQSDYWATPLEFLTAGAGDCEDYAILKYAGLRELGVPVEQLRLVVVEDTSRGIAHAVLAVRADTTTWILDNQESAILPDQRITHYEPYYSLNETGRWSHLPGVDLAAGRSVAGAGR